MIFNLEDVNLIYDMDKEVQTYALKNINLALDGQQLIGIMGPSGSGKSSLLYVMAGLKIPTSGKVSYGGREYSGLSPSKIAGIRKSEFGFIFQRHFLIDYMTVLNNVLTPINQDGPAARQKVLDILEKLGLAHLAHKKPHQLSGGQRQKVAVARALIGDPKVILADEPTAALDHGSAAEVMNFLGDYKKSAMIIVVTHDPSILGNADHVIHMMDGAITDKDQNRGELS